MFNTARVNEAVGMSAEAMVNATTGYLSEGETLYIATDEEEAQFFEPFRERCVRTHASV